MRVCFSCKAEWQEDGKPGFRETCLKCGADIHCCKNCKFYDPSSFDSCLEPIAEKVSDAENNNFCSYFVFKDQDPAAIKREKKNRIDPKKNFDDLFK